MMKNFLALRLCRLWSRARYSTGYRFFITVNGIILSVFTKSISDGVGNGKTRVAFEPEELTDRIDFQKDVPPVGRDDNVYRSVVQMEVVHQAEDFFFDITRQFVRLPILVETAMPDGLDLA